MEGIVIVGGGHAGGQLCARLQANGYQGQITLICEESELPYQRPPLSKNFLKSPAEAVTPLRAAAAYGEQGVTVVSADPVVAIDRAAHRVVTRSGRSIGYQRLVLATGSRPRPLAGLPEGLANVGYLRSLDDALRLRQWLAETSSVTLVGGGFIGLEIAATAAALGKQVTVVEAAGRLLGRASSIDIADHARAALEQAGVRIILGQVPSGYRVEAGRVTAMQVDGQSLPVSLLVVGVGALPETALARAAGLVCQTGVVVDALLQTSDPAIHAIGDCCEFPAGPDGALMRLESIQNANDQAIALARTLSGEPTPFRALPSFWSAQGSLMLQIAGIPVADSVRVRWPGKKPDSFSLLHFVDDGLVCVESVNAPLDHMAAKAALAREGRPSRAAFHDPSLPLRTVLQPS